MLCLACVTRRERVALTAVRGATAYKLEMGVETVREIAVGALERVVVAVTVKAERTMAERLLKKATKPTLQTVLETSAGIGCMNIIARFATLQILLPLN